jgi:cytochrome b561
MPAPKGFSLTQILLHWVVAALIVFQLIFGESMGDAWRQVRQGTVPAFDPMVTAHIYAGIAILALVAWRLVLRFRRGVPVPPAALSQMMQLAGSVGHWALYALMVVAPVSGLLAWYGGVDTAAEVHELLKPALIILIALHVAAALWHQFWLKDGTLLKMRNPDR